LYLPTGHGKQTLVLVLYVPAAQSSWYVTRAGVGAVGECDGKKWTVANPLCVGNGTAITFLVGTMVAPE
jgi:hypothetical protein